MWAGSIWLADKMALQERLGDLGLDEDGDACRCLPECNTVQYDAEILKTKFEIQEILQEYMMNDYNPLTS